MRDYLKILSSIIAALLSMAFLVSAVVGIVALISGNPEIASAVLFPFVFAWVGFVMFGIIGSLFWFGFLRASYTLSLGPVKRQILASLLRSEEHTSELQSRPHLVCRLLLEKKKKK